MGGAIIVARRGVRLRDGPRRHLGRLHPRRGARRRGRSSPRGCSASSTTTSAFATRATSGSTSVASSSASSSSPEPSRCSRSPGSTPRRTSPSRGSHCRAGTSTSAGWFFLAAFVIIATSNAVNLTDGLDGLAGRFGDVLLRRPRDHRATGSFATSTIYRLHAALDLGLVAVALVGALSRAFCGGTRAGAHHHGRHRFARGRHGPRRAVPADEPRPPAVIIGGLFVAETASVIIQVHQLSALWATGLSHRARSTTTSSCAVGPRPRSSSASGSWRGSWRCSDSASSTATS